MNGFGETKELVVHAFVQGTSKERSCLGEKRKRGKGGKRGGPDFYHIGKNPVKKRKGTFFPIGRTGRSPALYGGRGKKGMRKGGYMLATQRKPCGQDKKKMVSRRGRKTGSRFHTREEKKVRSLPRR